MIPGRRAHWCRALLNCLPEAGAVIHDLLVAAILLAVLTFLPATLLYLASLLP